MDGTAALIDDLRTYFEEVPSEDFGDARLRNRILSRCQATADFVWMYSPWPWKERLIQLDPGVVDLPAGHSEFATLGRSGAVFYSGDAGNSFRELTWRPSQETQRLIQEHGSTTREPEVYSIVFGDATPQAPKVLLGPETDVTDFVIRVLFDANVPSLSDENPGNLDRLCDARYHHTVVEAGAMYHLMRDKGDGRWSEQRAIFLDGLTQMSRNEVGERHTLHRMPRFGGRRSGA